MSNIFRRPMFRKGGEVGGGIMTGVMRENYSDGSARERLARVAAEFPSQAIDPVSQFLIQGGMNLAGGPASGAGFIADAARAFKGPTADLFKGLAQRGQMQKKLAIEGEILDIEDERAREANKLKQDLADQANKVKMDIANLNKAFQEAEGDKNRQNNIAVEIEKRNTKLAELQFKLDNPGADPAKQGVIPSIITQQMEREKRYADSDNLQLQMQPDFHARKTVNFERTASPEVLEKYKGIVYYGYGIGGDIEQTFPPGAGEPGDIIYDPKQSDFFIFDNQGNTYKYDPLTNSAVE